ncbi:cytochrome P450 [Aspergillus spectabilis]
MDIRLFWTAWMQAAVGFFVVLLGAIRSTRLVKRSVPEAPLWVEGLGAKARRDALLIKSKSIYLESYRKFKDILGFRIPETGDSEEKLVVSPKYLDELRRFPHSVLSFEKAHSKSVDQKYTNSPPPKFFHITPHIIKARLTPALARINRAMSAEADRAVLRELGVCNDWTATNVHDKMMRVIAVLSGRIFIGPELCHDERYIDAAINYTIEYSKALQDIQSLNSWLKPFVAGRLKSVVALRRREDEFVTFLTPVVQARRKAAAEGQKPPDDMLAWLMEQAVRSGVDDIQHIALIQLALFAVAFHTTALTATNVFYDIASRPEYVKPLREEIHQSLQEHDGLLTSAALHRLKKVDSFMKESLRFNPLSIATFQRRVLRPLTLSDGNYIPQGTILEIANHAISRDPAFFPDPDRFYPWRFEELRNGDAKDARHQFASVSQMMGTFGFGPHACPGRFFAAAELKMILAWTLLRYDVRMKDGEEGYRYENLEFGLTCTPDTTRKILFRRVSEGGPSIG